MGDVIQIERSGLSPAAIPSGSRYVGLEHIQRDGSISGERFVNSGELASAKFRFTPDHVLYGKLRPNLGKVACPDFEGVCSTDILPLRPAGSLSRRYLYHFLRQPRTVERVSSLAVGMNLPRISPQLLRSFPMPLPPLEEQRRIADVLDRADALRAKRRASLAQLDELTQSIFLDMFGDPSTNPRSWPKGCVADLIESATYGTSQKMGPSGKFPALRMGNVSSSGEIDLSDLKYVDLLGDGTERYLLEVGDIVFNRTNSKELVGKSAMFRGPCPMAYAGYLIRLRPNDQADPEFLASLLNTRYLKTVLRGMCKSIVGMANINAREIQALPIFLPPVALQKDYGARVRAARAARKGQVEHLARLDRLFASLQHRAFRGEL